MKAFNDCMEVREEFSALLDGELTDEEREGVESHLSQCSDCLRELESLKKVDVAYSGLPSVKAPEGFEADIKQSLDKVSVSVLPRKRASRTRWMNSLAAAAAAVLVVIGLSLALRGPDQRRFQTASKLAEETADVASLRQESVVAENAPAEPEDVSGDLQEARKRSVEKVESAPETFDGRVATTPGRRDAPAAPEAAAPAEQGIFNFESEEPEKKEQLARDELGASISLDDEMIVAGAAAKAAPDAKDFDAAADRAAILGVPPEADFEVAEEEVASRRSFNDLSKSSESAPEEMSREAFANELDRILAEDKPLSSTTLPSFIVKDGIWYERGYTDQATTLVKRDPDTLLALLKKRPSLAQAFKRPDAHVFQVEGKWYLLEARPEE